MGNSPRYAHRYVGPDTRDGLLNDTKCRILRKWAGGYSIIRQDGRQFLVAKTHVALNTQK